MSNIERYRARLGRVMDDGPQGEKRIAVVMADCGVHANAVKIARALNNQGAVAALRESAETLHRVSSWWEHAERSFGDCPAESCVKARAALGGQ